MDSYVADTAYHTFIGSSVSQNCLRLLNTFALETSLKSAYKELANRGR